MREFTHSLINLVVLDKHSPKASLDPPQCRRYVSSTQLGTRRAWVSWHDRFFWTLAGSKLSAAFLSWTRFENGSHLVPNSTIEAWLPSVGCKDVLVSLDVDVLRIDLVLQEHNNTTWKYRYYKPPQPPKMACRLMRSTPTRYQWRHRMPKITGLKPKNSSRLGWQPHFFWRGPSFGSCWFFRTWSSKILNTPAHRDVFFVFAGTSSDIVACR